MIPTTSVLSSISLDRCNLRFRLNTQSKLIAHLYVSITVTRFLTRLRIIKELVLLEETELKTGRTSNGRSIDESKSHHDYVVDPVRQLSVASWAILIEKSHRGGGASICSIIPTGLGERNARREESKTRGGEGGGEWAWQVSPRARDRKPTIDYQACYYDGERRFFRD